MIASGSPWVLLVQRCLRRLLGPGVPIDGTLGPETRRSIQAFQQQQGLPPTGGLDNATVQALQDACMGRSAAPPPPEEPPAEPPPGAGAEPPPAEPAGDGGPPPADGAAGPEGGAPAGGEPPPEGAPQGEITFGHHEGETEQEFLVDGQTRVEVERRDPVPLDRDPLFSWAPDAPGLYVISVGNVPWYVGIAEGSIRRRFLQRRKVLNDLQIPPSAMANRTVTCYLLRQSSSPRGAIRRREQGNPRAPFRPLFGPYAILRILEQVYIRRLKHPKGNSLTEAVRFSPQGSLTVSENGVKTVEYQPNSTV
jgi:peptidoglycan hydrolase-like protein with peptidoglycan-binding domain